MTLICWSKEKISFWNDKPPLDELIDRSDKRKFKLDTKFFLKLSYENLISQDDLLTEVFFNRKLMNFVTATANSKLIVWKAIEEKMLVHEFARTEKPIASMI